MGIEIQEGEVRYSQAQVFSVRIVSIDYYMAPPIPDIDIPYSPFHGKFASGCVKEVPVVRIYGSTPAGQKTCLHIHRVLPYLYVPCSELDHITNDEVDTQKYSLSLALEKALQLKGNAGSKRQHVHGCDIVRARKFYGYHSSEELFLKIYFYYPHDVSRASDLLLTGAVMDNIFQPYESHIPFLLQFLIDYNLYGMGHLHVSKVKFRNPVPDVFSRSKVKHQDTLRPLADDSTCINFQAALGGDLNTRIWTSSTIPDEWMWQYSPEPDSSKSEDRQAPLVRRQSTSELEVDAIVHDIVNRQLISNASLSQSHSEAKMVQSLIPIWEEEYERNGVPEAVPHDSKKPLPQDVLRILSDEIEFENLMGVRSEAENLPLPTLQSDESSRDLIDSDIANIQNSNDLPSKYLKASDTIGSLLSSDSPFQNVDAADQLQISGTVGPSTPKATDEDAIRLLKWLASSQAAEDINSDDELSRETIFGPLLPSNDIDKVLEIANVDYESESQKECQDILDSVDMLNFEGSNAEIYHSTDILSGKIIPQVDGSNDDVQSAPCRRDKSSLKTDKGKAKLYMEGQPWPELDSNLISKKRMKRPRWGSLPVSLQKVSDVLPPDTCISDVGDNERRESLETSCSVEESTRFSVENDDDQKYDSHMKQAGVIVECSTRDLMRRKRSRRTELSDCKGNINPDSKLCNYIEDPDDLPLPMHKSPIQDYVEVVHGKPTGDSPLSSGKETVETTMQFESSPCQENYPDLSNPIGPAENINNESDTLKLIGMTFYTKPPTIDWTDESEREAPGNEGDVADNYLPFFVRDCPEEEEEEEQEGEELHSNSLRNRKYIDKQEPVMGVPTIYQNDGSYLFMLTPALSPPSTESVSRWLSSDLYGDMVDSDGSRADDGSSSMPESASFSEEKPNRKKCDGETKKKISIDASQISGPHKNTRLTPLSQIGFRDPASVGQGQQLTLMSIEVLAESRGDLRPDPRCDAISIIVLVLQEDDGSILNTHVLLLCGGSARVKKDVDAVPESTVFVFTEELQLLKHFTEVVRASDPDVLMGWDVQSGSLGFVAERAAHLGVGLLNNISRTPSQINTGPAGDSGPSEKKIEKSFSESVHLDDAVIEDEWGRTHASGVHVGGRIVLNIWRLMRNEVKLNMYTVESVAEKVMRRKVPCIPFKVLTKWFSSGPERARYRAIDYTLERAKLNLQIMNQLDMINRTSELARVFGIDFFSVLSRGSQYRVESMFLRLAHTQNYLAISPGKRQVANQPAMECLPLVMEPESKFYSDPVIVLDFQSLYPSMVIAYNLCFCTCLGKITPPKAHTLGVSSYSPDVNILCNNSRRELLVTPNGVVYVPSNVRKGVLPRLLEEILSTRIMVKQAMKKLGPSQSILHRILNARQLALKLIANVTYGYTAAGFSGRMPCAELADSIVQCGRRTLEAAISCVNLNHRWKARVIYGDTDSMFVLLKGRSLKEAFAVGREIASAITAMNPIPVTLKMEKVYFPCFLLTKKRYVGYSYESPDQDKPIFDAKGIETVRRDTCGAVSKTMEQSLRIYFESQDIYKVKEYIVRQWTRILSGRISLEDFVFAKEVRLGTYNSAVNSTLPPAAIVATKSMKIDPRAEPRYGERVPYVVVYGEPGSRLVDMVVGPHELLRINSPLRLNDTYYISKQIIPALQRVFGLVGADLRRWFVDIPRPVREAVGKRQSFATNPQRMRIDYYYASKHCVICGDLVERSADLMCRNCSEDEETVCIALTGRTSKLEKALQHLSAICRHCGGGDWVLQSGVKCISLACSVFYERMKVQKELTSLSEIATTTGFYPECTVEWF